MRNRKYCSELHVQQAAQGWVDAQANSHSATEMLIHNIKLEPEQLRAVRQPGWHHAASPGGFDERDSGGPQSCIPRPQPAARPDPAARPARQQAHVQAHLYIGQPAQQGRTVLRRRHPLQQRRQLLRCLLVPPRPVVGLRQRRSPLGTLGVISGREFQLPRPKGVGECTLSGYATSCVVGAGVDWGLNNNRQTAGAERPRTRQHTLSRRTGGRDFAAGRPAGAALPALHPAANRRSARLPMPPRPDQPTPPHNSMAHTVCPPACCRPRWHQRRSL